MCTEPNGNLHRSVSLSSMNNVRTILDRRFLSVCASVSASVNTPKARAQVDILSNGLLSLAEMDSETHSETNSKPNGYIVLCRTFHIAPSLTLIPTPYFCIGQESESESVPICESGNVFKP